MDLGGTGADTIDLSSEKDYTDPEPIVELYVNLGRVSQMFSPLGFSGPTLPLPPVIFAPSCATHVVLSGLTDPVLPGLVPLPEDLKGVEEMDSGNSSDFDGTILMEYDLTAVYVGDASMQHMQIDGVSVLDAIERWVESNYTDQTSTIDSCNLINCNPTCLAMVEVRVQFDNMNSIDSEIIVLALIYVTFAVTWLIALFLGFRADTCFLSESFAYIPRIQPRSCGSMKRNGNSQNSRSAVDLCTDALLDVEAAVPRQRRVTPLWTTSTETATAAGDDIQKNFIQGQEDSLSESTIWVNNISIEVQDHGKPKLILDRVTATFEPGLTAVMGSTGSGKSSLLDAMVRNLHGGTVYGEILMGSIDISKASRQAVKDRCGYVMQLATPWDPYSTARQVLMYQAFLRLCHLMPSNAEHDRIASIVAILKMNEFLDTVVGSATGGGLSGGEKRKLAIAIQILCVPQFLILDEPTSGLDAASTLDVLQTLRWLGVQGHTVILSIHQPRPECWDMFERVLLLGHGRICFSGKVRDVQKYMATLAMNDMEYQSAIAETNNPADSILDALQHDGIERVAQETHANLTHTKALRMKIAEHVSKCHRLSINSAKIRYHRFTDVCKTVMNHLHGVFVVNRRMMHATRQAWMSTTGAAFLVPLLAAAVLYRNTQTTSTAIAILVLTGAAFTVSFNRRSLVMFQHCEVVRFDIYEGVVQNWQFVVTLYGWYGSAVFLSVGGTCCLAFQFVFGWDISAWHCFKFWVLLVTFELIIGALYIALLGIPKISEEVSSTFIFCICLFEVITAGFMVPKNHLDESMQSDILVRISMMYQAIAPVVYDILHERKFRCPHGAENISCGPLTKYSGDAILIATGFDDQNPKLGIWLLINVLSVAVMIPFAHTYVSHAFAKMALCKTQPPTDLATPTSLFSLEEVVCTSHALLVLNQAIGSMQEVDEESHANRCTTSTHEKIHRTHGKNQRFKQAVKKVIAQLRVNSVRRPEEVCIVDNDQPGDRQPDSRGAPDPLCFESVV